jgi:hypothetical protein
MVSDMKITTNATAMMRTSRIFWFGAALALIGAACAISLRAQSTGPMAPPASASDGSSTGADVNAPKPAAPRPAEQPITKDQPAQPVQQIVDKFAAHETEFREERDNFTYTQDFLLQTIDDGGQVDGEYRVTSDITFTPDGKRYEKITYAPDPTLTRITLSQEDLDDLENVQPFVLTTAELPKYTVTYVGKQKIDEVGTYVFDVAPKTLEKNQRYFQGRIWVDDHDFAVVKTDGKAVPDIHKGSNENIFPRFQTYRENVEGQYWFPTYTHGDDTLHFKAGAVHMRFTVKYADYKRRSVSSRLVPATTEAAPPDGKP